jgi:hypothetical protein
MTRATGEAGDMPPSPTSDLSSYERTKFELADIVRFAAAKVSRTTDPIYGDVLDFFARLGEDRFNLVVAGRFSRGKTSLMNAILGMDRLPTGIVPLTSVITSVGYGSSERVHIELDRGGWPYEVSMDEISQYITERGNPGNARGIRQARIQLPAEILRRGFYFIDTPGLGSSIPENTQTAMGFLPEADALVLVSGYDSPLSEDELHVLQAMASTSIQIFFVLNKQDTVAVEARREVIDYVSRQLKGIFGDKAPSIFSTSALDGLRSKLNRDLEGLDASGIQRLEDALTAFLIENKHRHFLVRMFERATRLLKALAPDTDTPRLMDRLESVRYGIDLDSVPSRDPLAVTRWMRPGPSPQIRRCPICERISTSFFQFLCHYQHALVTDSRELANFVAQGGFCAPHMWLYESLAAPRDICVALSPLLSSLSAGFRRQAELGATESSAAPGPSPLAAPVCQMCILQRNIESDFVAEFALRAAGEDEAEVPTLCIPHLRVVSARLDNQDLIRELLVDQSRAVDRLTEDMRRYALKYDGLRRYLMSEEERRAPDDALACLAGRRSLIR